MSIEQKRREVFEQSMDSLNKNPGQWLEGEYKNIYGQCAWIGFNAALDAIEIELPSTRVGTYSDYSDACGDCRAAIESAGLGIKIK